MLARMTLKTRLLIIGIALTAIPLVVVSGVVSLQNREVAARAGEENARLALADLDHIIQGVYAMCQAQQEVIQQKVDASLNVARFVLQNTGKIDLAVETVNWEAANQYTRAAVKVEIPKLMVGDTWLSPNTDISIPSPVVDQVRDLVGTTCTLFQRMSPKGDMLRISTNVQQKDFTRAVGTFIPHTNPDGTPNPVVAALLKGETFRGRAFVVDRWYITAYEPLFDQEHKVIGALYVGVPQESVTSLRQAIMETKVGKTGYVYVLDAKGNYIISKDGRRDGENIRDAEDGEGNLFIQEISRKAVSLAPGQIAEQKYFWKNPGDEAPRAKIARIMYFEPWDWVIAAGAYEAELHESVSFFAAASKRTDRILLGVLAGALLIAAPIWMLVARGIAGRISRLAASLADVSRQVISASGQVSSSSQVLAEVTTEQAANLQEISASLEELTAMTKLNADHASQAARLAQEARQEAEHGTAAMKVMEEAMHDIQHSAGESAKIIKVINEIAFQTNLLSLNAAVEAARAGDAGMGFAVVAEEVRGLALRSAEAARNTARMIDESAKTANRGVEMVSGMGGALRKIVAEIGRTSDLVSEIAGASQEQARGIDQLGTAVVRIDEATQQNAATAEESAGASKMLNAEAGKMSGIVSQLGGMVSGKGSRRVKERDEKCEQRQVDDFIVPSFRC